jgi:MinD superfamily P-loop ATPase
MDETDEVENPPLNERYTVINKLNPETRRKNKRFKCKFCTFNTTKKVIIVSHLRTHWKEKPFKCKVCGKCFSQQGNRNQH